MITSQNLFSKRSPILQFEGAASTGSLSKLTYFVYYHRPPLEAGLCISERITWTVLIYTVSLYKSESQEGRLHWNERPNREYFNSRLFQDVPGCGFCGLLRQVEIIFVSCWVFDSLSSWGLPPRRLNMNINIIGMLIHYTAAEKFQTWQIPCKNRGYYKNMAEGQTIKRFAIYLPTTKHYAIYLPTIKHFAIHLPNHVLFMTGSVRYFPETGYGEKF